MDSKKIKQKMVRHHNHVRYTITVNPSDVLQKGRGNRWSVVRRNVMELLVPYMKEIDNIVLFPDISFPRQMQDGVFPRIHYHGIVEFADVIGFLTKFTKHPHCQIEIDTIDDEKVWTKYCKKLIALHPEYDMYEIDTEDLADLKKDQKSKPPPSDKIRLSEYLHLENSDTEEGDSHLCLSE